MTPELGPRTRALLAYAGAAALSLYAALSVLHYGRADMRVPFDYGGDATFHAYLVKSVIDHGWFLNNPDVGAPEGLRLYDFPTLDNFHLLTFKVMSAFSGDWALLFNVYFLLGFPLITLAAMAALRQFSVDFGPAVVASVLYAFLPSRLFKGQGHLFLDVFYQVPLAVIVMLWVCGADPPLTRDRGPGRLPGLELRRARSWVALLICLFGTSMSAYYSFFAALLLALGGAWASFERRSARNALAGAALAGAIVIGMGANALPTIVYHARHGSNPIVSKRYLGESEVYGMKIAQLVLPLDGHRLQKFRNLRTRYNQSAPLVTENTQAALGVVGTVGFLALLFLLFSGRREGSPRADLLRPLAALNGMALLIATMGGFGTLFATIISPQIRTYTRMNVIIGFFALFAVAVLLERLKHRYPRVGGALLPVVLAIGLFDQTTPGMIRNFAGAKRAYASDEDHVRRIEAAVPPHALVLQLPYMFFPESPVQVHMGSYDHLVPYLHSRSLRWMFPAMRGRPQDEWLRDLSSQRGPALIARLRDAGGAGIMVDRAGYDDDGRAIEAELRTELNVDPIVSADNRRSFFKLKIPAGP